MRIDDALLDLAADMDPLALRSLDAVHLAAAQLLGAELEALVTYDARMAQAAAALGFRAVLWAQCSGPCHQGQGSLSFSATPAAASTPPAACRWP